MFLLYFDSDKDPLHGYKAMHIKISKTFQCIMYVQEVTVVNLFIVNTTMMTSPCDVILIAHGF